MRIVSLLPSTTEIAAALGFADALVGRSHECDYPEGVRTLPALTRPKYPQQTDSASTDREVKNLLEQGLSVYEVDADKLAELKPDIILTQDHCEVCAASLSDVTEALRSYTHSETVKVISVSPVSLQGIFESFLTIGKALNAPDKAQELVNEIRERFDIIRNTVHGETKKSVVTIEWIDPLMTAGNWIPEITDIAGGEHLIAEPGKHSPWLQWETVLESNPDVLLIMPCGYSFQQTEQELHLLTDKPGWNDLKAVQNSEVYLLEGNQYFNRPGPRIFESTRILAEILHPGLFESIHRDLGWKLLEKARTEKL
jgi:iron complex transport system substrate-binding protein